MSEPRALQIDKEFRDLLPSLTAEEITALEQSIEREGCRDALIVWGDMLVDGHNRHEICARRGFPFQVRQMEFDSREDVIIWICANQNARRNITPEQKAYLVGKRYEAEKRRQGRKAEGFSMVKKTDQSGQFSEKEDTVDRLARELKIGRTSVSRAGQYARAVDTLAADSPTIKRKILSGEINQSRGAILEIAAKPDAERKAAVERMEHGDPPEPAAVTKVCRSCGRELPLDCFVARGPGRSPIYCRQCSAMAHVTGKMSDVRADVREHIQTITNTVDALYNDEGRPDYTIDDVLEEIRLGSERFISLVRNAYEQHPALTGDGKNTSAINALLEDIAANIYNLRRG